MPLSGGCKLKKRRSVSKWEMQKFDVTEFQDDDVEVREQY
jgi:hypothetical protein